MRHTIRHTLVLLLLLTSAAGAGSIYKWVDDQGVAHYSDQAPEANQVVEGRRNPPRDCRQQPGVTSATSGDRHPPGDHATTSSPRAQGCHCRDLYPELVPYCRDAKNYFQSRGIVFKEYDIEKDSQAARRHKRYNPRGGFP